MTNYIVLTRRYLLCNKSYRLKPEDFKIQDFDTRIQVHLDQMSRNPIPDVCRWAANAWMVRLQSLVGTYYCVVTWDASDKPLSSFDQVSLLAKQWLRRLSSSDLVVFTL